MQRLVRAVLLGLLLIAVVGCVVLIRACHQLNTEVDRCWDDSSSLYIKDDAARARECGAAAR